jgi:hypothetical protein
VPARVEQLPSLDWFLLPATGEIVTGIAGRTALAPDYPQGERGHKQMRRHEFLLPPIGPFKDLGSGKEWEFFLITVTAMLFSKPRQR